MNEWKTFDEKSKNYWVYIASKNPREVFIGLWSIYSNCEDKDLLLWKEIPIPKHPKMKNE